LTDIHVLEQKNTYLSYRKETALQGGSVLAKSGRRYLQTMKVYLQPLWRNRPAKLSNSVKYSKIKAITPWKTERGDNILQTL